MVFYFSGTGNSYHVAKEVAAATKEQLINIAEAWREKDFSYSLEDGERIGFVYPIHSWAPPTLVKRFIKRLQLTNSKNAYVYSILTCGDDWEGAVEHIRAALRHTGLSLQGDYVVTMPNNYVMGHELDTPELVQEKLAAAEQEIQRITEEVTAREVNYQRASFSFFKSYVVYTLFQVSKVKTLFVVNDKCVGCGICEKACPKKVIKMKRRRGQKVPSWGCGCVQCAACINACPRRAIDSLWFTKNRRRYFNPEYKRELLKK